MPLAQSPGDRSVDFWPLQILRCANIASDESVQQSVFESCEKWWSEASTGQEGM